MNTLRELIDKHGFGVWLEQDRTSQFRPLARSSIGSIIGEIKEEGLAGISPAHFSDVSFGWKISPSPKKKIKLYPALLDLSIKNLKSDSRYRFYLSHQLFESEVNAKIEYGDQFVRWLNEEKYCVEVTEE